MSKAKLLLNDKESAIFRSRIYRILAAAFSRPKRGPANFYDALLEAHSSIRSSKPPLELPRSSRKTSLPTLAKEHLRLFVGPGHIPCPPYEAVHRKDRPAFERGLVMGPCTADVRRAYLAAGLEMPKNYTDLPDHIAAELEFMQFLCVEEARLGQEGNSEEAAKMKNMQREFHNNHLAPWIEDFADCVLRSTTLEFYKAAATVLKQFAQSEADHFAEEA